MLADWNEIYRLQEENTQLRAMLKRLEWAHVHAESDGEEWRSCPVCGNDQRCGHYTAFCWLHAALTAAPGAPS